MKRVLCATIGALAGTYAAALNASPRIVIPTHPDEPPVNGFPLLKAATAHTVLDKEVSDVLAQKPEKVWTHEEKQALVVANRVALKRTHEALRYPYFEPTPYSAFYNDFSYYPQYRRMSRVFLLAGDVAWEDGKQKKATDYYLDGITMGRRIPHNVGLIGSLVGIGTESTARSGLWKHVDQMDERTAMEVLARLQALRAERLPYTTTMQEEKYISLTGTKIAMEYPERLREYVGTQNYADKILAVYGKLMPRRYVIATMGAYMDKLVAQVERPYITDHQELPLPNEIYTQIMLPVFVPARCKYVASNAGDALLRTALALRIYRLRNGEYPKKLADLVTTNIIDAVPEDPFALPGTPLRYTRSANGYYLLYSIGPDGIDNKGIGIASGVDNSTRRAVKPGSKGDMVVGWYNY